MSDSSGQLSFFIVLERKREREREREREFFFYNFHRNVS